MLLGGWPRTNSYTRSLLGCRLPVHERQWVRHVIGVPGGGSAYATAGEVGKNDLHCIHHNGMS